VQHKTDSLPEFLLSCPSKKFLHFDCPGCGMQRAYYAAYKGNFKESVQYNPGALPFVLLIIFTVLHLKFKFRLGHKIILWGFIITALLMWLAYLIKLIKMHH
jgi:hypothetical protein